MQIRQIHQTLIDAAPILLPVLPASLVEVYTTAMMGGSIASYVLGENVYIKHGTPTSSVRMAFLFLRDHDRYAETAPDFIITQKLSTVEYYIKKAIKQIQK
jgi:hypothetical protein